MSDVVPFHMNPAASGTRVVHRESLTRELMDALLERNSTVGITTALQGAGGFGKTTLASAAINMPEVLQRFPDGVLWITIGEQLSDASLASKINDLSEIVAGERPALADPDAAGHRLGEILDGKSVLLVIDDVWKRSQLRPLLQGAPNCTRLVTTRIKTVLPAECFAIEVDAMEAVEAVDLLTFGFQDIEGSDSDVQELVQLTGRWPVLLELVNGTLRRHVRSGGSVADGFSMAIRRLRDGGPASFDVRRPSHREEAVAATMESSLGLLDANDLARFEGLAIFPDDTPVPESFLARLWADAQTPLSLDAQAICIDLDDLSLLQRQRTADGYAVLLHDVVRAYLRQRVGSARLMELNRKLVDGHRHLVRSGDELASWWELDPADIYLWRNLLYHLVESGYRDEAENLVDDLRWSVAKIEVLGPAEVEADLDLVKTTVALELRSAMGRHGGVLSRSGTAGLLGNTLVTRLLEEPNLRSQAEAYTRAASQRVLRPLHRLPDSPHPALRRVLRQGGGRLLACGTDDRGEILVGGGESEVLTVWDLITGEVRQTLEGHNGAVFACAFNRLTSEFVSGGDDGTVRVWSLELGECVRHWQQASPVRAVVVSPDGQWIASAGDAGNVSVLYLDGRSGVDLAGNNEPIRTLAVAPDGSWLAAAGDDRVVWLWNTADWTQQVAFEGHHTDSIYCVAVAPDGSWIASCSLEGIVCMWSLKNCELVGTRLVNCGPVLAHGPSDQGRWMVTGGDEGGIQIWDLESGLERGALSGHSGRVRSWVADPGGRWLATSADDQLVLAWDMEVATLASWSETNRRSLWACVVDESSDSVYCGGEGGRIYSIDIPSGQADQIFQCESAVFDLALLRSRDLVCAVGQLGEVELFASDGTSAWRKKFDGSAAFSCDPLEAADVVVVLSYDGHARVLNLENGDVLAHVDLGGLATSSAIVGEGLIAFGLASGVLSVRRLPDLEPVSSSTTGMAGLHLSSMSESDDLILMGGEGGTLRVWNWRSGIAETELRAHRGRISRCISVGQLAISVSLDNTLQVWDLATSQYLCGMRASAPLFDCDLTAGLARVAAVGDEGLYLFEASDQIDLVSRGRVDG